MLNINRESNGTDLTIILEGRLDTNTSPELDTELKSVLADVKTLTFDMANLAYISSAGLRVLLSAQKVMNKQGSMTIKNVAPDVMEIFEVTGFSDILTIE
ncbi:anti-sigma B factor antagonist [Lachnospiraceae bacterium XBB2008]|nr:anti-sigma B factor antagonist [Lachnospiraceae bacterium XBB2008]